MSDSTASPPSAPGEPRESFSPPPAAARVGAIQAAARSLRPVDWISAVSVGVAAFVVAYLVAVVSLLLTTAIVVAGSTSSSTSGSGSLNGSPSGSDSVPSVSDLVTAVTVIFGAPAQLVVLGDFGRLSVRGSVTILQTVSGSVHVGFVPVLILAAQLLAIVLGVRLFRSRRLDLAQQGVLSVATGATLAAVTLLIGLLLAIRLPDSQGLDIRGITAVDPLAIIAALVVGSCVALAARPGWIARLHPLASRVLGTARVAALHLGVVLVVIALVVIAYGLIARPSGGAAYPLLLGNIAVLAAALGFFGGASLSESAGSLASTVGNSTAPTGTLTVFTAGSGWVWLLVVLTLLTAFCAGLALVVRRASASRTTADWVVTVLAYAGVGLLLQLLGTVVFSVQVASLGGSGSAGVTPWTIAVLALWGAAIEAVARFVAPAVLTAAPPGVARFTGRLTGRDADGARSAATPADPAASAKAADGLPTGTPLSPRKRTILVRSFIAGGIVLVLLIGGAIAASTIRSSVYGPGQAARAYLTALSTGDAESAAKQSGARAAGTGMLRNSVLKAATNRIQDIAIGDPTVSGDIATVPVTYRQAGKAHDASLRLTRTGTSWLVHDTWRVDTTLTGHIDVATDEALGAAPVRVGGKTVGTVSNQKLRLTAYPGTYVVSVAGTKYFGATSKKVTVAADSFLGQDVDFQATPTPQLVTDAKKVVNDLIATCAKSTSGTLDDSCPFSGPGSDAKHVSYKVTEAPTLEVALSYSGKVRVSSEDGSVKVTYDEDFGGGYVYHGDSDQSLYLYETLAIVDGKLVLAPGAY